MRRTHYTILLLLLFTLVIIPGCSIQKLAIRSTGSVLDASFEALMAEDDLELAKTAIESDLKILEGFLNIDSSNKELLLLAAQGFASYAWDLSRMKTLHVRSSCTKEAAGMQAGG